MDLTLTNGISDEQADAIRASFPTCPTCAGEVAYVVRQTTAYTHFSLDIDGSNGEVLADEGDTYDTIDSEPVTDRAGTVLVACANRHEWHETRIRRVINPSRFGPVMVWQLVTAGA